MTEIVYNRNGISFDIDAIATDLNGKADVDLSNVNNSGNTLMAKASMPSVTYDNLTLGANGTQYTAPANGWYTLRGDGNSSYTHAFMTNINNGLCSGYTTGSNGNANVHVYMAAQKGQKVQVDYSDISTVHWFRFVYAKGSESEAS